MNYATSAEEVIGIIPDKLLDEFSLETGVDCFVKKLKGKDVFKLFLYALYKRQANIAKDFRGYLQLGKIQATF